MRPELVGRWCGNAGPASKLSKLVCDRSHFIPRRHRVTDLDATSFVSKLASCDRHKKELRNPTHLFGPSACFSVGLSAASNEEPQGEAKHPLHRRQRDHVDRVVTDKLTA